MRLTIAALAALFAFAQIGASGAQSPDPLEMGGVTDEQLESLDAMLQRLKKLKEIETLKQDIKKLQSGSASRGVTLEPPAPPTNAPALLRQNTAAVQPSRAPGQGEMTDWKVQAIIQRGGQLAAVLTNGAGSNMTAQKGDLLEDGSRITLITETAVQITKDDKQRSLSFYTGGTPGSISVSRPPVTSAPLPATQPVSPAPRRTLQLPTRLTP